MYSRPNISVEQARPGGPAAGDDEMLARQARDDPQAFAELYRRHARRIYQFHLIRTGNVNDAQDLTSQTFLAALEGIENYGGHGSLCGWLFGIARHKVADHYRRRRNDVPLESAEVLRHPDPSPEETVDAHLRLTQVSGALGTLSPEQAEALTLRVFGELSAAEVGRIMGKSEVAVRMLVYRGLRRLRGKLTLSPEVSQ